MAESFWGSAVDDVRRVLHRLRILFGIGLVLAGMFLFPRSEGRLFWAFCSMAAAYIAIEVVGPFCPIVIAKHVELVSMVLGAGAVGFLARVTGGAKSPLLPLLICLVFLYGLGLGSAKVSAATIVSLIVTVLLSLASIADGAEITALLGPSAVAGVLWLGTCVIAMSMRSAYFQIQELQHQAQRDPLTGLLNRRSLNEVVDKLILKGKKFSIVLADLDGFKRVNDQQGHLAGDRVLKRVAEAMQRATSSEDAVVRYGGDEFAVVVPGARENGELVMQRLKEAVESVAREENLETSLSGGVAVWPDDGSTVEELLQAADCMLYGRKRDSKDKLHGPSWGCST